MTGSSSLVEGEVRRSTAVDLGSFGSKLLSGPTTGSKNTSYHQVRSSKNDCMLRLVSSADFRVYSTNAILASEAGLSRVDFVVNVN